MVSFEFLSFFHHLCIRFSFKTKFPGIDRHKACRTVFPPRLYPVSRSSGSLIPPCGQLFLSPLLIPVFSLQQWFPISCLFSETRLLNYLQFYISSGKKKDMLEALLGSPRLGPENAAQFDHIGVTVVVISVKFLFVTSTPSQSEKS